jgi:aspartate 1-decarboxylase
VLTLGRDVIEAAGFYPLEHVEVYNVSNVVVLNGAAARLGKVGDAPTTA